jgi:hypothetical protein
MTDHRRSRIHEGGHAVAVHAFGRESGRVVVFAAGEAHTHYWEPTGREAARRGDAGAEANVIIALAGEAALEVFGDPAPRRGAQGDRQDALGAAWVLDRSAPGATVARLYPRALALMREHRAAIERFADTLALNGDRLAGHEVSVALEAAFGGWPTPRFDSASEDRVLTRKRAMFEIALRDTDTVGQRIGLMRDCESAARAGVSLAEYRRTGLYAPAITTVALKGA